MAVSKYLSTSSEDIASECAHLWRDSNISLRRAAIQFPYLNDVVASVVLGMTSVSQVEENFEDFNNKISPEFWTKLKDKELIHPNAPI